MHAYILYKIYIISSCDSHIYIYMSICVYLYLPRDHNRYDTIDIAYRIIWFSPKKILTAQNIIYDYPLPNNAELFLRTPGNIMYPLNMRNNPLVITNFSLQITYSLPHSWHKERPTNSFLLPIKYMICPLQNDEEQHSRTPENISWPIPWTYEAVHF